MLPISVKPLKDELLSSWLIRTAIANKTDPLGLSGGIWENTYRFWTRDCDRFFPKDQSCKLSKYTGFSYAEHRFLTLEPIVQSILDDAILNPNVAWAWVIPRGHRNRTLVNGLHFCSHCLDDPPVYFKKQWRLSWNTACAKHKILLRLHCPKCYTAFSPHLITYTKTNITQCQQCGFDLRKCTAKRASEEVIAFQEKVNTMALEQKINASIVKKPDATISDFFKTMHLLQFIFHQSPKSKALQTLCETLNGEEVIFKKEKDDGATLHSQSVERRYQLFSYLAKLLSYDTQEIIKLFQDTGVTPQMLLLSNYKLSPCILEVISQLKDNSKCVTQRTISKTMIEPRCKEDVERLMDEIRPYIQ